MSGAYTLQHGASFVDAACLHGHGTKLSITAQVIRINNPGVISSLVDQHCMAVTYRPISGNKPTSALSLEPHHELIIGSAGQ
jgi:hypothetical protein